MEYALLPGMPPQDFVFFIFKMNSIMREIANATFALLLVGLGIRLKFCLSVNGLIGGAC